MSVKERKRLPKLLTWSLAVVLTVLLVVLPVISVLVYESVFGVRYETPEWFAYEVSEFDGLQMEPCNFSSEQGQILAGYRYHREGQNVKGLVVLAHGLGGGGHNAYMPLAAYFTSQGYLVFAYDVTGNDHSEGDSVRGLPQGIVDLDYALRYVKTLPEYEGLNIVLFGHSWGGYSVGCVLNYHPDVKAVVIAAGMNRSVDLIAYQGEDMVGGAVHILLPYVMAYESIKFGSYAGATAVAGFEASEAGVMVLHSQDDATVPARYGHDVFLERFGDSERFQFVLFSDRGHDYLYHSNASAAYRKRLNEDYKAYVEANGGVYSQEIRMEFLAQYLDKSQCYELDEEIMAQIVSFYDTYCQ